MYDPSAGYAKSSQESQQPRYYFTPGMDEDSKEASKERALAQQKKHNDAQYSDGLFGLDDIKQAGHLGWESLKTELYDNWSPVGNMVEWGAKNILPWNWFNKDTSWNAIRARSRQRVREMNAADDALGNKYGFSPGWQMAIRAPSMLAANLVDPMTVAMIVGTGGVGTGVALGLKAAKAGKGIVRSVQIANKARKIGKAAHELNTLRRVYGGATRAQALANKAGMGLLHRGWRNVAGFGKLPVELGSEALEWGLSPSIAAGREEQVYRGADGLLYQKDPEILRSMFYKTVGLGRRNPNETALGPQTTAMLDYMAQQYGVDAEDLYTELAQQGISPEQAYQYTTGYRY